MAIYALIHGAGDVGWYWHLVERELQARGHRTVAPDLPIENDSATLSDNADAVIRALDQADAGRELVVVGQSYGGYVAPIVADRTGADLLVLVAGVIPQPGETAGEMWEATGWSMPHHSDSSAMAVFYHDVEPALAREALSRERRQSDTTGNEPWPLAAWPKVPTRFIVCRNDRIFPADWLRGVVRDRLGIEPDEIDSGHTPALSHPVELADCLESIRKETLGDVTA